MLYIIGFCVMLLHVRAASWNYDRNSLNGPQNWHIYNSVCGGQRQSPININTDNVVHDVNLPKVILKDTWSAAQTSVNYTVKNTGEAIKLTVEKDGDFMQSPVMTTIGSTTWRLANFHLHWSGDNNTGSEHTKNGKAYPAEIHFVHVNTNYSTAAEALANEDGAMVLGFFISIPPADMYVTPGMRKFFDLFKNTTYKDDSIKMMQFPLKDMLFRSGHTGMDLGPYFTYPGSLTTPNCSQAVKWMVFDHMLYVTADMMTELRGLQSQDKAYVTTNGIDNPTVARYRPTQSLNGRVVKYSKAREWEYKTCHSASPSKWHTINSQCGGTRQSPINIIKEQTVHKDRVDIKLEEYWMKPATSLDYTMENSGHSVSVKLQRNGSYFYSPIFTTMGSERWRLIQFHLHWSGNNYEGSEHTVNGEAFPAELHLIHVNPKYNNLQDALSNSDGLLVFGFFIKHTTNQNLENSAITDLVNHFTDVKFKGKTKALTPFTVSDLMKMGSTLGNYYKYDGSLTTPGCNEVVTWIVFEDALHFTSLQLDKLRALQHHDEDYYITHAYDSPVVPRYRPVQRLHSRTVYYHRLSSANHIASSLFIVIAVMATICLY